MFVFVLLFSLRSLCHVLQKYTLGYEYGSFWCTRKFKKICSCTDVKLHNSQNMRECQNNCLSTDFFFFTLKILPAEELMGKL